MSNRCIAIKTDKKRCTKTKQPGSDYCAVHCKQKVDDVQQQDSNHEQEQDQQEKQQEQVVDMSPVTLPTPPNLKHVTDMLERLALQQRVLERNQKELEVKLAAKMALPKPQHKRVITENAMQSKARWLFYHDIKRRPDVVSVVNAEFSKSEYAKLFVNKNVPWLLVKSYTDLLFTQLSEAERQVFVARAANP